MKILYVHNDYARPSGEENAADSIAALLGEHGHEVRFFRRSSAELHGLPGKIKGFFAGIWNPFSVRVLDRVLAEYQPDVVQVQNLYPLLSPFILPAIRKRHIPVIMRCPNYRLFCPNGLCCDAQGNVCELCLGGHEWHCIAKKCAGGAFKSTGYALRNTVARKLRVILDHVDMFIVQTEFQREKFIRQGIPAEKIGILPGIMQKMVPAPEWTPGKYVTFIGRVSAEKGIADFLECAGKLPEIPFAVAGSYDGMPGIREKAPANVEWRGFVKGEALRQMYLESRIVAVPSRCYEGFPNVIVQAMQLERPVAAAALGASGAVVLENVTGVKFPPRDPEAMSQRICALYNAPDLCRKLGQTGRKEALERYSRDAIYAQWEDICRKAMKKSSL